MRRLAIALLGLLLTVSNDGTLFGSTIGFEPDVNGQLPDGSVAVDDMDISDQYLASHGVSFGLDVDGDGHADTGLFPTLERVGMDGNDAFRNELRQWDTALPGFEAQLGEYFLRNTSPNSTGDSVVDGSLLLEYANPVSYASGEIWDLDGLSPGRSERCRIDGLDASGQLVRQR